MKSIHEASVAYGREHQGTVNIEDFEAGANYVLDEFVDIVNKNTKPNGIEDRAKMAFDMLILIKQLKK